MGKGTTPWRLAARSVACERGARRLLSGVDLTLEPGELLVVRGANGSGKTTLLRVLAGLSTPAEGQVRFIDKSRDPDNPARLVEETAYLGHLDAVKASETAARNLNFWAAVEGAPAAAAGQALEAVGLSSLGDLTAGALSAGQRRRLGFARLLLRPRPVWILDEPLTGLDARWRPRLAQLIDAHRARGGGVIVATHDDVGLDGAREAAIASGRLCA